MMMITHVQMPQPPPSLGEACVVVGASVVLPGVGRGFGGGSLLNASSVALTAAARASSPFLVARIFSVMFRRSAVGKPAALRLVRTAVGTSLGASEIST